MDNEVLAEVLAAAASTLAKKALEAIVYNALVTFIEADEGDAEEKRNFLSVLASLYMRLDG